MDRQIKCECGYIARGSTDDDIVYLEVRHRQRDHVDPRFHRP